MDNSKSIISIQEYEKKYEKIDICLKDLMDHN